MKKIMIAFVAMAMATAASASTFNWGITTALDTEKFASGKIYLFAGNSIADLTDFASKTSQFTIDNVKAALGGELANLTTAPNTIDLVNGIGTSTGNTVTAPTGNNYLYVVAIADGGADIAVATSIKTVNIRSAATPSFANYTAADFKTYSAVPEPTSGLLLLLGVAGMALRRRRA